MGRFTYKQQLYLIGRWLCAWDVFLGVFIVHSEIFLHWAILDYPVSLLIYSWALSFFWLSVGVFLIRVNDLNGLRPYR